MDYKAIINLMKEMNLTDLTKLEIEEEGVKICIEKANVPFNSMGAVPMQMPVMQGQMSMAATQLSEMSAEVADKKIEEIDGNKLVSPMVGTFYASPSPDKPPFVKVGDKVKKGQTICIIEAMKLLNEIESDHDGEIVKILVNNESMVEFGQPLFLIK